VRFLPPIELGLFPPQAALCLSDLHALAGAQLDQVGLELGNHGEDVEQQPADRVGGVINRRTQGEADLAGGEFVGDRSASGSLDAQAE
jgi:hypothetical protein